MNSETSSFRTRIECVELFHMFVVVGPYTRLQVSSLRQAVNKISVKQHTLYSVWCFKRILGNLGKISKYFIIV